VVLPSLNVYEVRFRARLHADDSDNAGERLGAALAHMPGITQSYGADLDRVSATVGGGFQIEVIRGMGAAARDSSRLAKEALKAAQLGQARLVELSITLRSTT